MSCNEVLVTVDLCLVDEKTGTFERVRQSLGKCYQACIDLGRGTFESATMNFCCLAVKH